MVCVTLDVTDATTTTVVQVMATSILRLLRHPVLTPKTVGAALVEVFAVILPVEATTPLVDAPPDIGSEHGVCDA